MSIRVPEGLQSLLETVKVSKSREAPSQSDKMERMAPLPPAAYPDRSAEAAFGLLPKGFQRPSRDARSQKLTSLGAVLLKVQLREP